jgi:hypothetical protein
MEDEGERVAELSHPGLRVAPADRVGVEGRADTACAAAGHEDRVGIGELPIRARERRPRVQEALLVHADRSVADDPRPRVDVPGAGRDVHDRVIAKGIRGICEVEDPAVAGRIVERLDPIVEPRAAHAARLLAEAAPSALEEDEQPLGIRPPEPERVPAAAGAARRAAGLDPLPPRLGRRCGRLSAPTAVARRERDTGRGHDQPAPHGRRECSSMKRSTASRASAIAITSLPWPNPLTTTRRLSSLPVAS